MLGGSKNHKIYVTCCSDSLIQASTKTSMYVVTRRFLLVLYVAVSIPQMLCRVRRTAGSDLQARQPYQFLPPSHLIHRVTVETLPTTDMCLYFLIILTNTSRYVGPMGIAKCLTYFPLNPRIQETHFLVSQRGTENTITATVAIKVHSVELIQGTLG